jgi:hypothetical protein
MSLSVYWVRSEAIIKREALEPDDGASGERLSRVTASSSGSIFDRLTARCIPRHLPSTSVKESMPRQTTNNFSAESLRYAFGWHQAPWIRAFNKAMSEIDRKFLNVLELGAAKESAMSLVFLDSGSQCNITCYADHQLQPLAKFCEAYCARLDVPRPMIGKVDIFALPQEKKYDLIILKGVLGGLHIGRTKHAFENAIRNCISQLDDSGYLIVMDKGWCTPVHNVFLRKFGAAGRVNWHYFTENDLSGIEAGHMSKIYWSGFFSLGVMPFKWMESILNWIDKVFCNRFLRHRGTVFCAVYQKGQAEVTRLDGQVNQAFHDTASRPERRSVAQRLVGAHSSLSILR